MTTVRILFSRILDLVLRRPRDARLTEEIQTHLDLLTDEYIARGMAPSAARHAARRAFGGVDQLKAVYQDQRGLPFLDALAQDVRFAARLLRRDPGFALTAVLVLGLGIGVNNMLFTILYAHTMRGLPMDRADRVVFLSTFDDRTPDRGVSYPDFVDWRQGAGGILDLAAFRNAPVVVAEDGRVPDRFESTFVSANAFALIGAHPVLGREFTPDDDLPGAPAVVILGAGAWQSRYGNDRGVLGRPILVNGVPATVIGVMPDRSGFPSTAQVWLPLSQLPGLFAQTREARILGVLGRVRDRVSVAEARAAIEATADRLSGEHPVTNQSVRARVVPINERYMGSLTHPAWMAFMAAGFVVVLISCANVANLLLARSVNRAREIAIRTSLGASRGRVIRQLLIEGSVLATLGGLAGLAVAISGVRLFWSAIPENVLPYWFDYSLDGRVVWSLVLVSIVTVFVFALVPAIHATKTDVNLVLKDGGSAASGRRGRRWTTGFLAAEFALAVILLGQLAVSIRSAAPPLPSDAVIDTNEMITAVLTLPGEKYKTPARREALYRELRERLTALPAVSSAALVDFLPLMGGEERNVGVGEHPPGDGDSERTAWAVTVSPGYFETLGLTLERGRQFSEDDGMPGQEHAIVNRRFAEQIFGDRDPIGQRIALNPKQGAAPAAANWLTIVGLSPSVRQRPGGDPVPVVYLPFRSTVPANATLIVRSAADSGHVASLLRDEVARLDPSLPLHRIRTMPQVIRDADWNGRLSKWLILVLTFIAVALSTVGLYAVASYGVSQEAREIGLRMALGAQPRQVVGMVLRRVALQLAVGFGAGIVCARVWDWMFTTGRPDVTATDPQSLILVAIILAVLAAVASYLPARRATRLDPVAAIRHQ